MRRFFRSSLATLVMMAASCGASAALPEGKRLLSLDDMLQRSEVEGAVLAPDGSGMAVQVTRPLSAPGVHAGAARSGVQPRGDIWLFDEDLAAPTKLPADDLWVWAPAFSPSGSRLAALYADADGRVGVMVWDLAARRPVKWGSIDVDVNVLLRTHGAPDMKPSGWALRTRAFVWIDDQTVLLVDRNGVPQQYGLAPATAATTYAALRGRTKAGQPSIRVWNDQSPTEGVSNRLLSLDVRTGKTAVHYEGDVRGVSLSPDGARAALLVATRHLKPAPGAMEPPLRSWHLYDDAVELKLIVQPLANRDPGMHVQGIRMAGPASDSRLPLWSDDGRRIGLAGRASYTSRTASGDDVAWEIDADTQHARELPARSALDAELIASLLAGSGECVDRLIDTRPSLVSNNDLMPLGQVSGKVWRFADGRHLVWSENTVQVVDCDGTTRLPGEFDFVYAADVAGRAPRFILFRQDQHFGLGFADGKHVLKRIPRPPYAQLLVAGAGGSTLYLSNDAAGTSLHLLGRGPGAMTVTPFNRHMGAIAVPEAREISHELDGKTLTGILRLPPGRRDGDRHPVVLTAYPGYVPGMEDGSHRGVNSNDLVYGPFQHLLSKGFAVFVVPFPVDYYALPEAGPLQMAVDTVTPWLAVLERQPEILSGEYAFWGHSNAGYVGLALAARTDTFKAIAVSSTFPDLHWTLDAGLEFTALQSGGNVMQVRRMVYEHESQPYAIGAPPWQAQDQWISNSPVYNLEHATTPMLLLVGEFDFGTSRPMERVYSILYGKGVPAELAMYWGEAHVIASPGNVTDAWTRTEQFFSRYLRKQ
ncbi:prolyl oligopeptidase family serine peptidase [Luteimonas sp. A482]